MPNSNIMSLDTESCSKWFRGFTENNDISATKLAGLIGTSHGTISNWINGLNTPSTDNWCAVAELVAMEPYELIMAVQMGHTPPIVDVAIVEAISLLAGAEALTTGSELLYDSYAKLPYGSGMKVINLISRLEAGKIKRIGRESME